MRVFDEISNGRLIQVLRRKKSKSESEASLPSEDWHRPSALLGLVIQRVNHGESNRPASPRRLEASETTRILKLPRLAGLLASQVFGLGTPHVL